MNSPELDIKAPSSRRRKFLCRRERRVRYFQRLCTVDVSGQKYESVLRDHEIVAKAQVNRCSLKLAVFRYFLATKLGLKAF
jgi:hypothetical protein